MSQTILTVEDNHEFRTSLVASLHAAGFVVLEAQNAEQAMNIFLGMNPDLVLLDLGIGGANGMDVLRKMKRTRPWVPAIIVSRRTQIHWAIEAFRAGAWDYVTKPIASMEVFINTLRNCLSQSGLQARVRESQEHLARLIQNLPLIIFIINRDLEFEFLNQATEEILGYSPAEILGSPQAFLKLVVPEDRKPLLDAMRRGLEQGAGRIRLEFRFRHKNGYLVFLQAQSIAPPLHGTEHPNRLEGMIIDVTHQTYLDDILIQNERLSILRSLTEEVAHEIRNPMVSLGGFARKLQAKYPEEVETEVILNECNRLERLVQRINAYLAPMEAQPTGCAIASSLAFLMRLFANRFERKNITILARIDENLPAVSTGQEFINRIFIYLLGHAADILQHGGNLRIDTAQSKNLIFVTLTLDPVMLALPPQAHLLMPFEDGEHNLATCFRMLQRIGGHLRIGKEASAIRIFVTIPLG